MEEWLSRKGSFIKHKTPDKHKTKTHSMEFVVQSCWIKERMMVKVKDIEREMTMVNNLITLLNNTFSSKKVHFWRQLFFQKQLMVMDFFRVQIGHLEPFLRASDVWIGTASGAKSYDIVKEIRIRLKLL